MDTLSFSWDLIYIIYSEESVPLKRKGIIQIMEEIK